MKAVSWNVNGRVGDAARRQVSALLERSPDVICLQEVRRNGLAIWEPLLEKEGFHTISSVPLLDRPYPLPPYPRYTRTSDHIQRAFANLIATRAPIKMLAGLEFSNRNEKRLAFP